MENVEYPCFKCEYFPVCGDIMRTEPCAGRQEDNVPNIGHYPDGKPIPKVRWNMQNIDKK